MISVIPALSLQALAFSLVVSLFLVVSISEVYEGANELKQRKHVRTQEEDCTETEENRVPQSNEIGG